MSGPGFPENGEESLFRGSKQQTRKVYISHQIQWGKHMPVILTAGPPPVYMRSSTAGIENMWFVILYKIARSYHLRKYHPWASSLVRDILTFMSL